MEGFINLRLRPWLRRLITRLIAIIPAVIVVWFYGERGTGQLLILSQVVLSLQLLFRGVPAHHVHRRPAQMGPFANPLWVKALGVDDGRRDRRPERIAAVADFHRMI